MRRIIGKPRSDGGRARGATHTRPDDDMRYTAARSLNVAPEGQVTRSRPALTTVCGTLHQPPTGAKHVGVDHRRPYIVVAEQLLNRANVVAVLQ